MATENIIRIATKHKYTVNLIRNRTGKILILSLPMLIGVLGAVIMNLIDTVMIGALGPNAIAAVNLSIFTSSLVVDFTVAMGAAVLSLCARRFGEGRKAETKEIFSEAILIALTVGIPLSIAGAFAAPHVLPLINSNPLVIEQGTNYLRITNAGWILIILFYVFQGYYDGIGRPYIYLKNIGVMGFVNVTLNYCLINGNFHFPAMGTSGAAIATVSSYFSGIMIFVLKMIWENRSFAIFKRCRNLAQRSDIRKKIIKLSASIGVQNLAIISGFFVFMTISGKISVIAMAITGIVLQLANTLVLFARAFGRAGGTLAGQALGAALPKVAFRRGLQTGLVGLFFLSPIFATFLAAPEFAMTVFTKDPDMITSSVPIIQILGIGMTFDVFATILMYTMLGTGWVRSIVIWNILGIWVLFIPLSVVGVLYLKVGVLGLWISLFVYRVAVGIAFLFEYHRKKWLSVKI